MRTTAKLKTIGRSIRPFARSGQLAHRHNTHFIAVFFTKQRLRTHRTGIIGGHNTGLNGVILTDHRVHFVLHSTQFNGTNKLAMAEIKPQPIGCVQRSSLRNMVAQRIAQRLVQQVRNRMICLHIRTADRINAQLGTLPQ